jgi:parallel beta-helix repeat protein
MRFFKLKGRSLTFLTIMFVGAMIAVSLGAGMSVQAATAPSVPLGDGSYVSVAYTISKDSSGYTIAKNSATGATDFRDTNSRTVIQKAVDKLSGGYVYIKAGTYYMTNCIYTNKVSIVGDGNATILKANGVVGAGIIRVCDNYWTLDYRYMSSRPNGVTVANLQVNGQSGGPMKGVCFIDCLNCRMIRLYVHDIQACQGLYMSNSQYCSISRCQIANIGDNSAANYGSGIAFGEASTIKVASSHITIDRCYISKASMSSIDLEPANNVAITNCVFRDAASWRNYRTPVITMYQVSGYAANDYVSVSGCNVYGSFNEFIVLTPSSHSTVKNNVVTYTAGSCTPIYATNSHYDTITGNRLTTASSQPIHLVSCSSCTVSGNTIIHP